MTDLSQQTLSLIDVARKQEKEYKRVRWLLANFLAVIIDDTLLNLNAQIDTAVSKVSVSEGYKPSSAFNDKLQAMLDEDSEKGNLNSFSQMAAFQNWVFATLFLLYTMHMEIVETEHKIMMSEVDKYSA